MRGSKQDLINYRIARAKDTFEDAQLLIPDSPLGRMK